MRSMENVRSTSSTSAANCAPLSDGRIVWFTRSGWAILGPDHTANSAIAEEAWELWYRYWGIES